MCAAGSEAVTVKLQASSVADTLSILSQRMNALDTSTAILAKPRISNAAAQVLNHAAGEEFRATTCGKYAAMGQLHPGIVQLSQATGRVAADIVENLDLVIDARESQHIHFTNIAALDSEVQACMQLFAHLPALRQDCKWEFWVLTNYVHFKAAFPGLHA
jgi:hypothetical protein